MELCTAFSAYPPIGATAFLPIRLYRRVVYPPPGRRHVRQTVSIQIRGYGRHVSVRPRNVSCPVRLVSPFSDEIEATFAPGRLDPSISDPPGQDYRRFPPNWSRGNFLDDLPDYLATLSHLVHVDHRPAEGITIGT